MVCGGIDKLAAEPVDGLVDEPAGFGGKIAGELEARIGTRLPGVDRFGVSVKFVERSRRGPCGGVKCSWSPNQSSRSAMKVIADVQ